ncbi:cation diffusion facilitator family transporter [Ancylobacter oerskovii]|uniref:Cation diffusion facilitator family transporter n=1 Tax=Ancylobacter oerskovii TaxID=459519 RepID=A0ABW4YSG9_9HYPH|nr:cation transporter [Ancylobacter oerskovii]
MAEHAHGHSHGSGHSHGGGHSHGDAAALVTAGGRHKRSLYLALALTFSFMVVEVVGGLWTGSLALVADAVHMLTDAGGLVLALVAIRFAERPATPGNSYGYVRMEVLAALANAVVLLVVTVFILYEAWQRLLNPPEIIGGPMLAVAVAGLAVNLVSMRLLSAGSSESLNVKGAYFEVLADMLGSLGVILAAVIVMFTGWTLVDPLVGAGIGLFIVPRTWILLKGAVHILMEGTPPDIDLARIEAALMAIEGVEAVHDLHVWTLTSGMDAMSGHVVVRDMARARATLAAAQAAMQAEFGLSHLTIQIEDAALRAAEAPQRL